MIATLATVGKLMDYFILFLYSIDLLINFSIMILGYGDIVPTSPSERGIIICFIFLGGGMMGYVVANVTDLVNSMNSTEKRVASKVYSITVIDLLGLNLY